MAKITTKGLDDVLSKLDKLGDLSRDTIGEIIYDGAGFMADAIKAEIKGLPVTTQKYTPGAMVKGITSAQKTGLLNGFGISKMEDSGGSYNIKLGFNGYNSQHTKKYPQGQPNSMIARSLCSGTSFREKNDFVGRAIRKKKACIEIMRQKATEKINDVMGG